MDYFLAIKKNKLFPNSSLEKLKSLKNYTG